MNYALILAGGVGQRMRNSGMPKQFLEVFGKPVIIYTLEKFDRCKEIDKIVIACNASWTEHMQGLLERFQIKKVLQIVPGGKDRQDSLKNGIAGIKNCGGKEEDIIVIHDGVRPLVQPAIISDNVRVAMKYGCAMTVTPVVESVVVTSGEEAGFDEFQKRDDTYSLTAPQTFRLDLLQKAYEEMKVSSSSIPILDAALAHTYLGNKIHLVKETNHNIKITTPEDYYILKAMLELEENKYVFGF